MSNKNFQIDRYNQQLSRRDKVDPRDQDIKFVKRFTSKMNDEEEGLVYMPPKKTYKFYQICSFKNPNTQMYDVRVIIFNEHSEVFNQEEYMYDEKECNKLINLKKSTKLKFYPTFDIDLVALPDMDDLLKGKSSLLI